MEKGDGSVLYYQQEATGSLHSGQVINSLQ